MHHKRLATLFVAALFTVASASAEITFEHVAAYVATAANDDPQLSADGKLIAVQRNRDGNETVDIIKLDGGDVLESFQFKQQIDVGLHRWIDAETLMRRDWRGDPHWGIPSRGRPERFNFKQRKVKKLFSGYEYTEKMQDTRYAAVLEQTKPALSSVSFQNRMTRGRSFNMTSPVPRARPVLEGSAMSSVLQKSCAMTWRTKNTKN